MHEDAYCLLGGGEEGFGTELRKTDLRKAENYDPLFIKGLLQVDSLLFPRLFNASRNPTHGFCQSYGMPLNTERITAGEFGTYV